MKKSTKKKIRDIRSALVMVLVMVAMLSTASYAWFSMTDSPTVAGMQMTAATSGSGLEVSNEGTTGTFHTAIQITDQEVKTLKPVTPLLTGIGEFQEGVYTGNEVTGLSTLSKLEGYVAKYTYYLRSTAEESTDETIDVGIICGSIDQTGEMKVDNGSYTPSLAGSFVRQSPNATGGSEEAAFAVRIGLVPYDQSTSTCLVEKMVIWEPNNGETVANVSAVTQAKDSSGAKAGLDAATVLVSEATGNITKGGTNTTSGKMFSMLKGSTAKIDMYIWLEGTDTECVDQIQADDIEAQIQFTVVEDEVAATP